MLKPLKEMYNSDTEWLTTLIPTDEEGTPLFWADFGEQLDKWLYFRAGAIAVNDNVSMFVSQWFALNEQRLEHMYYTFVNYGNSDMFKEDIAVKTVLTDDIAEKQDNRTFKNLGGADTTTTTPDNDTTTHFTTSYENSPNPVTRTEYSDVRSGSTTTSNIKTSQHTDDVTHTAHKDTHTTEKTGHDRPLSEVLKDSVDMHQFYSFADTFVNIFIHDLTTGVFV